MAEEPDHSTVLIVIKSIFLCIFMVVAVTGNTCVLHAIRKYKKLQTVPILFVFNLAVADILFALTGIPMNLATTIAEGWILGSFLCDVGGLFNTLFCTVSIWTLVMISVNRYFAVAKARDIKKIYTKKRTLVLIVGIWVFSFIVSMPPLLGWSEFTSGANFCTVNGKMHLTYSIFLVTMDYIIPFSLLTGFYLRIFFLLRKHEKILQQSKEITGDVGSTVDTASSVSDTTYDSVSSVQDYEVTKEISKPNKILAFFANVRKNKNKYALNPPTGNGVTDVNNDQSKVEEMAEEHKADNGNQSTLKPTSTVDIENDEESIRLSATPILIHKKKGSSLKRFLKEARVTKMLLIVVLGYVFCWTPFLIASVLFALNVAPSNFKLLTFGIMTACLNSVINPIIYAVMNRNFRDSFQSMYGNIKRSFRCGS